MQKRRKRRVKRPKAPRSWLARNWPNIVLFLVAGLFTLLLMELAVRILFPQTLNPTTSPADDRGTIAQYDPRLGWRYKENTVSQINGHTIHLNNFGMRMARNVSVAKERPRIAVIGDSFMWGFNVDESEMFATCLQERFPEMEVLNFAVSGYGTDQYYLALTERAAQFEPDVVIVGAFSNDLENAGNAEQYGYPKPLFVVNGSELLLTNVPVPEREPQQSYPLYTRVSGVLEHYSQLYVFVKPSLMNIVQRQLGLLTKNTDTLDIIQKEYPASYAGQVELTTRLYCEMAEFARERDIKLVIVNIPSQVSVEPEMLRLAAEQAGSSVEEYDPARQTLLFDQIGAACNITVIDLRPAMVGHPRPDTLYHGHWTAEGEAVAADTVATSLVEQGIVQD